MSRRPNPLREWKPNDENQERARQALRLAEEIEQTLACLTHEAFDTDQAGQFCYNPQVSYQAIARLSETLENLKVAIEEVKY